MMPPVSVFSKRHRISRPRPVRVIGGIARRVRLPAPTPEPKVASPLDRRVCRAVKRAFDVTFSALVLLTVFPPVLLVVTVVTKLTMPGPVFFSQRRTGFRGREFMCLKFRSMRVNEAADERQATRDDPRKTKWGAIMRRTNVDELPQFVNVLLGDMSVVGPRPHMVRQTEEFSKVVDGYMMRHDVKPGITGLSQVRGFRGEIRDREHLEGRVRTDIWYIEHWSVLLDLRIIAMTALRTLSGDRNAY